MPLKTLFGLTFVPAGILAGILLACISKRVRDIYFVLLVFLSPAIEHLDVNFVSREWYRGTSRGFEVSLLDVFSLGLLVSSVLAPRRNETRGFWPPSLGFMLLLFMYACFNVAIADPRLFGAFELAKMLRGFILVAGIAFYLRNERELRLLLFALAALICFQSLLALKQRYVGGIYRVPGTFEHENSLSVLLCLTAPLMVAAWNSDLPKLLKGFCGMVLPLACVAIVLTISRAGVVIMPLVLLLTALTTMSYRITFRKLALVMVVVVGAAGITAKSWNSLMTRFGEASMKEEYGDYKKMGRGYYLMLAKAIAADRWFGVGLNNWSYWVSNHYGHKFGYGFVPYKGTDREPSLIIPPGAIVDGAQAAPAHNLGALTLGELGIPGLVLLTVLWLRWLQMGSSFLWPRSPDPMRRIGVGIFFGLCGLFMQSWTEWVFRQLGIYYMAHILVGVLAGLYYMKRHAVAPAAQPRAVVEVAPAPGPLPATAPAPCPS